MATIADPLPAGDGFGQYEIVRLLGRGGMGEVYEAKHRTLQATYALKLINEEILDGENALKRFEQEARVAFQLDHPNVVKVDDFNEVAGRHYLRMELMPGIEAGEGNAGSLEELLQLSGGRLSPGDVRQLLKDMLMGLGHAHEKGVIHRDLKPANILLGPEGAKISDFGLIRMVGEEWMESMIRLSVSRSQVVVRDSDGKMDSGSATNAYIGTYDYMSPEQREGQEADERSDLYAVGLMAFRMLTGHKVPGFTTASELIEEVGTEWDPWIARAIHPKAERRFQSADEMLDALLLREPLEVAEALPIESAADTRASASSDAWMSRVALTVLLFVLGRLLYHYWPVPPHAHEARSLPQTNSVANGRTNAIEPVPSERAKGVELELERLRERLSVGDLPEVKVGLNELRRDDGDGGEVGSLASDYENALVSRTEQLRLQLRDPEGDLGDVQQQVATLLELEPTRADVKTLARALEAEKATRERMARAQDRTIPKTNTLEYSKGPMEGRNWLVALPGGQKLEMVWIRPGEFLMGSPWSEADRDDDERQHRVRLTRGYWLGKYEVTQGQWQTVMGSNPSDFKNAGKDAPVEQVSWEDAMSFCRKVTERERRGGRLAENLEYTLPTEAQWEYACRAGTSSATAFGNSLSSRQANFDGKRPHGGTSKGPYLGKTIRVGSYRPNAWGLYDMHGNVWEWCRDWYGAYSTTIAVDPTGPTTGSARVNRGGCWFDNGQFCRSAVRDETGPDGRGRSLGFRLCLCSKL